MSTGQIFNLKSLVEPGGRQPTGLFERAFEVNTESESHFDEAFRAERQAYDSHETEQSQEKLTKMQQQADNNKNIKETRKHSGEVWHQYLEASKQKKNKLMQDRKEAKTEKLIESDEVHSPSNKELSLTHKIKKELGIEKIEMPTELTTQEAKALFEQLKQLGVKLSQTEEKALANGQVLKSVQVKISEQLANPNTPKAAVRNLEKLLAQLKGAEPTESGVPIDTTPSNKNRLKAQEAEVIDSWDTLPQTEKEELLQAIQAVLTGKAASGLEELSSWLESRGVEPENILNIKGMLKSLAVELKGLKIDQADLAPLAELVGKFVLDRLSSISQDGKVALGEEKRAFLTGALNNNQKQGSTNSTQIQGAVSEQNLKGTSENSVVRSLAQQTREFKQWITGLVQSGESIAEQKEQLTKQLDVFLLSQRGFRAEADMPTNLLNLQVTGHTASSVNLQGSGAALQGAFSKVTETELSQHRQEIQQTAFEQARQTQQYIDLFTPKAPQQLREQVALMYHAKDQFAQLRLDPPELGKLNIRLQINSEQQASVVFMVSSPQAREAIEQAMPRLRELLEEQGIQLADADVKEDTAASQQQEEKQAGAAGSTTKALGSEREEGSQADSAVQTYYIEAPTGQIDFYV